MPCWASSNSVALFFLLLALDCALRERLVRSALAVGVGFMVKLTPVVFLPVALRQLWSLADSRRAGLRDGALYVVSSALTVLALAAPFILIQPVWLVTMARAIGRDHPGDSLGRDGGLLRLRRRGR